MNDYKLRYYVDGVKEEISFPTVGEHDNLRFKISAKTEGDRYVVSVTAKCDVTIEKCTLRGVAHARFGELCFVNGYQSWTKTKEFFLSEKERDAKKIFKPLNRVFAFDRYGDATFFDYNKNILHGYDVFFVRSDDGAFIINLNYKNAYLIIVLDRSTGEISLRNELDGLKIKAGESFVVSDFLLLNGYQKGLEAFNGLFPKQNVKKLLGYTSWYNYYQNISEDIILRDLDALDGRFDLFQIDDGYETFVGDWLDVDPVKFPNGLAPVIKKIRDKGFKAGLWLAPFVAEEKSKVFKEHPDWFDFGGEKVKCGSNWSGFYALNLSKREVLCYIEKCLQNYVDMGVEFFKLDFMYAANLPLYDGITRSMAAERAYSFVREVLKDKLILGCGATLMNAACRFDYMRIGPDVSLKFDDAWYMRRMHNERVSTKVTLENTVYRSFMNDRLFGNDPDVFLLRDDNIRLSKGQKRALITLNALFGSLLMTSDNIAGYNEEKKALLAEAIAIRDGAKVTFLERAHDVVNIEYALGGENKKLSYNTKKGIFV